MHKHFYVITFFLSSLTIIGQGSFHPNADMVGSNAIHKDSNVFVAWASSCITQRGPQDIAVIGSPLVTAGDDYMATDKSGVNGVVSLGDGGVATLTFDQPLFDGPGYDFAVFENSFSNDFLELAFVEVSSDGANYVRFDATSEVQTNSQVDAFGLTDPTEINNLAGKYRAQYGTPFDLNELDGITFLDVQNITHVRVIDVIGSIAESFATFDAFGNKINDPYPTDFASGGFDLDAIGVINEKPLSIEENEITFKIYPNPASILLNVVYPGNVELILYSVSGQIVFSTDFVDRVVVDLADFPKGVYFVSVLGHMQKLIIN